MNDEQEEEVLEELEEFIEENPDEKVAEPEVYSPMGKTCLDLVEKIDAATREMDFSEVDEGVSMALNNQFVAMKTILLNVAQFTRLDMKIVIPT